MGEGWGEGKREMDNIEKLTQAVQAALAGDWEKSHSIAQDYDDDIANWIHAVLHKIEGDAWNSKYWYARTNKNGAQAHNFEDFSDTKEELTAILQSLS